MPDWLPDIYEIKQRFRCNPNVEVEVKLADGGEHTVIVGEFATVGELMETIYESELLGGVEDKYAYWVFKTVQKEGVLELVALLNEEGVMECISRHGQTKALAIRRRIFCAWYSLSNDIIRGQHFSLFFHELSWAYLN